MNDSDLDCMVELHIIRNYSDIDLLNLIIDPKDNAILYAFIQASKSITYSPDYLSYKKQHKGLEERTDTAYLLIEAINIGEQTKAYEEKVRYEIRDTEDSEQESGKYSKKYKYRKNGTKSEYKGKKEKSKSIDSGSQSKRKYTTQEEVGVSSWYAANQMVMLNGKKFEMNTDKIFYDGSVTSGVLELIVSFQEAFWDVKTKRQTLAKKHRKKFHLELDKGDNIKLEIIFICKGFENDIRLKLYRKREVRRGMYVETYYDPIL